MQKISLKDWVILLTIVPTTIIGLAIAGYFSYSRYVELDNHLSERSRSIIEPLAIASTEPLLNKQREKLRHLIGFAHRSQSSIIKSITVFTNDNQVFVTSAYHGDTNLMRLKPGQTIPSSAVSEPQGPYLIFRAPIIHEQSTSNVISLDASPQVNIGYVAMQVEKSKISFDQQSQILVAFSIVIFGSLLSAIFAIRLIKNVTRPISSMVKAVDRIREGKLESRVSGQLVGELNFLKNGVNAMAQSLGDYHDEMQRSIDQATIDLRESLEQFEIQNVELDIAKRKAQDANKVKSEFLANMSHELRTPLNGVIGFTRQVLKTPLSDTQRDYLQTIERSAGNLLAIINDILDFSKLDAGKMVIEKIPFSLRESIEETLTLIAPSAHNKHIELSLNINQNLPDSFIGDAMRIKQVIINLASNAIKFTNKGSVHINIDSQHIDDRIAVLKVAVEDTGIGMSAEQKKTIFEAFGQADKSVTRLYGGTGLGLVISQRLVSEMHGEMGFESKEQQGSTFWFSFQCEVNPIQDTPNTNLSQLKNKSILLFESNLRSNQNICKMLESWQMRVTSALNEKDVRIALSSNQNFDFALIGHDVTPTALNELKELIVTMRANVPSIHLAINSTSPNLQEALIAVGANNCFSKPITADRVVKALLPKNLTKNTEDQLSNKNRVPIKVLAVDDNDANLKLINALLHEQVHEVTTAVNGQDAVELCQHEKFALIFMDIQMPVMDGITALQLIKAQTFNDETPIIAVTAHAMSGERDKLLKEGFDSYMTKPIDEAMLRHTIYEYCDLELLNVRRATKDIVVNHQDNIRKIEETTKTPLKAHENVKNIIDWTLALKRAGNKSHLAKDMLTGLLDSLPETKSNISEALTAQDIKQLKTLIHKLNGACCYSGVPNLGKVVHQIETQLKQEVLIEDLEPEFFELFEHIDSVINYAPAILEELTQ